MHSQPQNRLLSDVYFSVVCHLSRNHSCYYLKTGIITSYGLWLDGVLVLNSSSSQRFFTVEGLAPWSRHILRLQACTARGCGKGPMVSTRLEISIKTWIEFHS